MACQASPAQIWAALTELTSIDTKAKKLNKNKKRYLNLELERDDPATEERGGRRVSDPCSHRNTPSLVTGVRIVDRANV